MLADKLRFLKATTFLAAGLLIVSSRVEGGDVAILPDSVALHGPNAQQRLILERRSSGEFAGQIVEDVRFESSHSEIVVIDSGVLRPVSNGSAVVSAHSPQGTASARITVSGMNQPWRPTFGNHVLAVLAKSGCNSGACHGALAGKGGFRLSLRGYAPARDHYAITREARGRRIELSDPGRSLFLAKPTGALPHKGGVRFNVDSAEYRILSEWIMTGAAPPSPADPQLKKLEILPRRAVVKPGSTQQLIVRAHFDDGRVEDVTRWAAFTSASEAVATVDRDGAVRVVGYGEGAVNAWFASRIVSSRVTSPYENPTASEVVASEQGSFIDKLVARQLRQLNLRPSPPASDEQFLRRIFLDTIGTLPTADEVVAFRDNSADDKRERVIDELLERPEFVDYWTYKWSDLLTLDGTRLRPQAIEAYYKWIRSHVSNNTPWDQFVREIVTAQGGSFENGATNFYALHQDPENMAENVSQAFLGLSIACAKCHNHPLEKWTNNQYYAFANLFSRVRAKGWGGDGRNGDGRRTLYVAARGELLQPLTGKPQPPAPLDGEPLAPDATDDRRIHLAQWLTSPDNKYFARSITNRVWAGFLGVGLVEPVDDMRASNPASNEELLSATAQHLVDNEFDIKALIRTICRSETYQRSSRLLDENRDERRFYARYYPRRLMAEVLLDAISQVTGVPTPFTQIEYPGADMVATETYKPGTRAIQLYDSAVVSYFLKTFGRNQRRITCECERSDEPSMVQALHISNGETINSKLQVEDNQIGAWLEAQMSDEQIVERAYLASLARFPTEREKSQLVELLASADLGQRRIHIEDMLWGIMSSREFLFNH